MTRFSRMLLAATVTAALAPMASATQFFYTASLDGPSESPPVPSLGTGLATLVYDDVLHTMTLAVSWRGLTGNTTVAHTHGPTATPFAGNAGVMTTTPSYAGFPTGITHGSYTNTFDMTLASSYNPSFVTANGGSVAAAEVAMANAIAQGRAYLNIHSTFSTSGEIRGFWTPIPEPSTLALLGLAGLVSFRRR